VAAVAQVLAAELPGAAGAALHAQHALAQALPVRCVDAFLVERRGQAFREMGHSAASDPTTRLLTGLTSGPPMTRLVSWRRARAVLSPRTCRTASMTSSKPCM